MRLTGLEVNDFPVLTMENLENLTFGTYQYKLAPSYVQDKIQRENDEVFEIEKLGDDNCLPQPGLIRVRVYSRFSILKKSKGS